MNYPISSKFCFVTLIKVFSDFSVNNFLFYLQQRKSYKTFVTQVYMAINAMNIKI